MNPMAAWINKVDQAEMIFISRNGLNYESK